MTKVEKNFFWGISRAWEASNKSRGYYLWNCLLIYLINSYPNTTVSFIRKNSTRSVIWLPQNDKIHMFYWKITFFRQIASYFFRILVAPFFPLLLLAHVYVLLSCPRMIFPTKERACEESISSFTSTSSSSSAVTAPFS